MTMNLGETWLSVIIQRYNHVFFKPDSDTEKDDAPEQVWEARVQQEKPAMFPCLQYNSVGAEGIRLSANTLYLQSITMQ